jgi:hypothetical protein
VEVGASTVRVVQLQRGLVRRVAIVEEPFLRLLAGVDSTYALAQAAIAEGLPLAAIVERHATDERIEYDAVYIQRKGSDPFFARVLSPIDHPVDSARCLVSGTGLTHLGSAADRDAMHGKDDKDATDSMRMFRAGLAGGRPNPGECGTPPEWFYKGDGTVLRAHGEPLVVPFYAEDGGEEAEIAGVYLIDPDGEPRRIGMAAGNEFSDHKFEKTNYLNLAGSKLRTCAIGPELVINPDFDAVPGHVSIERAGRVLWRREIATGESEMCHSLANIEHHHFKFEAHRRPGDVHVHFYGACSLSFGDGLQLVDGDVMAIQFAGFGRPLRNPVNVAARRSAPIAVRSLA